MRTIIVQIENRDNTLTQSKWAYFFENTDINIKKVASAIHFSGTSLPTSRRQNAAWIFEINETSSFELFDTLKVLATIFDQDSIAWTEGETIFIKSK